MRIANLTCVDAYECFTDLLMKDTVLLFQSSPRSRTVGSTMYWDGFREINLLMGFGASPLRYLVTPHRTEVR